MQDAVTNTAPRPQRIVDQHGRVFDYLRVALTERCNFRCIYCTPERGVDMSCDHKLLSAEELQRVIAVAVDHGVTKIRFTGGEPLLRKDVVTVVRGAAGLRGVESVHLTTNGMLLHRFAEQLQAAGLTGVNLSLDSLDAERFRRTTRRTGLERVLQNLQLVLQLGFSAVKVNVVAMRGVNDDQLADFAELTREQPLTVRFIELMPFDAEQVWRQGLYLGAHRIVQALQETVPDLQRDEGSSTEEHVFRVPGWAGKVAVIPSFTRSLCGTCNRIRLTADGQIRNCLYSQREYDVRAILREGGGDEQIAELLLQAMSHKLVDGWAAQRQRVADLLKPRARTSMTQIGG